MNQNRLLIGPGSPSLLLIICVLSMSILSVLSFLNARQDCQLSLRSLEVSEEIAQLNSDAETSLAKLDSVRHAHPEGLTEELLPEDMTLSGNAVSWEVSSRSRTLSCSVILPANPDDPLVWEDHRLFTAFESMGEESYGTD